MDRRVTILALGGAFVAYAAGSLLWSLDPLGGGLWFATLIASAVLGTWIGDLRRVWACYTIGIAVVSVGLILLLETNLFGINQDIIACLTAVALAACLAYNFAPWFTLPLFIAVLAWAQSRGAILAAGVAFGFWLWSRFRPAAVILALVCTWGIVELSGHRMPDIWRRLGVWQDTINHLTLFGAGLGSFFQSYAMFPIHTNMTLILPPHAYNDALELLFELGLGAIPLFWLIVIALEESGPGRLIVLTFLALGLTYFPLFIFPIGQLFALTLGSMLAPQLERIPYGSLETDRVALH